MKLQEVTITEFRLKKGLNLGPPDYESVALYGIEKLRFPMQPTELQVLCKRLQTC